ncbi:MAG: hypothetical protein WAV32_06945 [Halobacteriota archaeon]
MGFRDKIRVFIFYSGLPESHPITLISLILSIATAVLSTIYVYVKTPHLKIGLLIFTVAISFLFFVVITPLMFPPAKQVKILIAAYGNNPRIIPFIARKVKRWLDDIVNFMEKQPSIEDIRKAMAPPLNINSLEKTTKRFLKPSSTKRFADRVEKKGIYLNELIKGVSESLQIPQESIKELINTKVDVTQKISKEIFISYDQIKNSIEELRVAEGVATATNYCCRKIEERIDYLEGKGQSLNAQIKWLKEFDERKGDIPTLLEIINESSAEKAVSKLSKLLYEEAKNGRDILWLVRVANSRKGVKIGELLGIKIMKGVGNETLTWYETQISQENLQNALEELWQKFRVMKGVGNETLTWYETQISQENLQKVKGFLGSFVRLRSNALEELWEKFINWNEKNEKLDLNQPIAIGLASGYSVALRRILKGICEHVQDIKKLDIILISEAPGDDEEVLRAELKADYLGLRCDIMPIDVIEKKEMERQINSIFVGIESINKQGDIVHPKGGSDVIRKIKKYEANVYAFGESYKVLDFTEDDIDYTKLSLSRNENIDYVVTDHGVHERDGKNWRIEGKLVNNLDCCAIYWKEKLRGQFF